MKYVEVMTPSSSYVQNLVKKLAPPLGELYLLSKNVMQISPMLRYDVFVIHKHIKEIIAAWSSLVSDHWLTH